MEVIDYNGEGRWTRAAIERRYVEYTRELRCEPRDVSPSVHTENGRQWIYPVMFKVIEGIEQGDAACIRIGIEFIYEDGGFPFGANIKARTARALRRVELTAQQAEQIRRRGVCNATRGERATRISRVRQARARSGANRTTFRIWQMPTRKSNVGWNTSNRALRRVD